MQQLYEEKLKSQYLFYAWLKNSGPGQKYIYYTGDCLGNSVFDVRHTAHIIYGIAQKGLVYLVQRKLDKFKYEYIAIKAGDSPAHKLIPYTE